MFLKEVCRNKEDMEILYELLKERIFSISHSKLPSFEEHASFVRENPYRYWYLIFINNEPVGSVYVLMDNGIGVDLKKSHFCFLIDVLSKIKTKHAPLKPIKSLRGKDFYINVNPKNHLYIEMFEKNKMKHIQSTYLLS